jgi:hypothetical protein
MKEQVYSIQHELRLVSFSATVANREYQKLKQNKIFVESKQSTFIYQSTQKLF